MIKKIGCLIILMSISSACRSQEDIILCCDKNDNNCISCSDLIPNNMDDDDNGNVSVKKI